MSPKFDGDRNWAVALVHGIGVTEPSALITQIANAIKASRPELQLEDHTTAHDAGNGPPQIERRGKIGSNKIRFATAHWSDVSFIREGLFGLLGGLLMTGLGVRFFANVAADRGNIISKPIQCILTLMVLTIALLIVPITLVSLVMSTMALAASYVFPFDPGRQASEEIYTAFNTADFYRAYFTAVGGMAVCTVIGYAGCLRVLETRKERKLGPWLFALFGLFGVVFSLILLGTHVYIHLDVPIGTKPTDLVKPDAAIPIIDFFKYISQSIGNVFDNRVWIARSEIINLTGMQLSLLRLIQIVLGIAMLVFSLAIIFLLLFVYVLQLYDRSSRRGILFAVSSTISIWILFLFVLWPENLMLSGAMTIYSGPLKEPITGLVTFKTSTWEFTSIEIHDVRQFFSLLLYEVVYFFLLISIFVLAIVLLLSRQMWRSLRAWLGPDKFGARDKHPLMKSSWPRFIVPLPYMLLVIAFTAIVSALPIGQVTGLDDKFVGFLQFDIDSLAKLEQAGRLGKFPDEFLPRSDFVKLFVVIAVFLFLVLAHYIRDGMKLFLDIINHFTGNNSHFPIRDQISRRLHSCVDHLLLEKDQPNLVILAHSQGTVITLDALLGEIWQKKLRDNVTSLTIVTFGSPITHVYQHYFSHMYPRFSETNLKELADDPRVSWYNCYRVDDYIGTFIDHSLPDFPINIPLKGGGHTNYWEPEVFERLFEESGMDSFLFALSSASATATPSVPMKTPSTDFMTPGNPLGNPTSG